MFVLIGIELLVAKFEHSYWLLSGLAVGLGLGLAVRYVAVWLLYRLTRRWLSLDAKAPLMMTCGGLRGGISVALALSISVAVPHKGLVMAITYAVVLFSVIGQRLTLKKLIRRLYPPAKLGE